MLALSWLVCDTCTCTNTLHSDIFVEIHCTCVCAYLSIHVHLHVYIFYDRSFRCVCMFYTCQVVHHSLPLSSLPLSLPSSLSTSLPPSLPISSLSSWTPSTGAYSYLLTMDFNVTLSIASTPSYPTRHPLYAGEWLDACLTSLCPMPASTRPVICRTVCLLLSLYSLTAMLWQDHTLQQH